MNNKLWATHENWKLNLINIGYLTLVMKIYAVFGYGYVLKEFMFKESNLYDVKLNCLPCDWQ